jgi:hypothetical protein
VGIEVSQRDQNDHQSEVMREQNVLMREQNVHLSEVNKVSNVKCSHVNNVSTVKYSQIHNKIHKSHTWDWKEQVGLVRPGGIGIRE